MAIHADHVKPYVGQWVQCHSMYGMYEGILYRVSRPGIILMQHTQLASYSANASEFTASPDTGDSADITQVQFFGPGMFLPWGGIYGIWPRVPFII